MEFQENPLEVSQAGSARESLYGNPNRSTPPRARPPLDKETTDGRSRTLSTRHIQLLRRPGGATALERTTSRDLLMKVLYDIDSAVERDTWLDPHRHPQHVYNDLLSRQVVSRFLSERVRDRRSRAAVDIGGGEGIWSARLQQFCDRVVVLDISPAMLAYARKKIDLGRGWPVVGDAEKMPLARGACDGVLMFEILQFVNPAISLREAARVLVSGGWLICSFSNAEYVDIFSKRLIQNRRPTMKFYTLAEMERALHDAGFQTIGREFVWLAGNSWVGWFRRIPVLRSLLSPYYNCLAHPVEHWLAGGPLGLRRRLFRTIFILAQKRP